MRLAFIRRARQHGRESRATPAIDLYPGTCGRARLARDCMCHQNLCLPKTAATETVRRGRVARGRMAAHDDGNQASLNFFFSTPWLITTARSLPTAFITVTSRCAGAFIRNSSLEYSSSFDGMVASA